MSKYWYEKFRDEEVVRLWREGKTSRVKIAMDFNLSAKTIERILKEAGGKK